MKLRIATWNIHKGVSALGSRPRVHGIKQALSAICADVVFLQEVQGRHDLLALKHTTWPSQSQHEFLAGEALHCAYGMNAVYDHGHHGNALLSSYPIASAHNHDVSDHAFESRGILHCVLKLPVDDTLREIHCYVIHLGLFAGSRLRQTQALIDAVKTTAPADAPLLIAGDFNDWTNALSETLRHSLAVTEVFDERLPSTRFGSYLRRVSGRGPRKAPARTFPAAMPVLQLDRIYVRGFDVLSAEVRFGASWARLSDHAPIIAELAIAMPPRPLRPPLRARASMRAASYSHHNRLTLLHRGTEFFPALIRSIDAAESEIHVETYIFALDPTGLRVMEALRRAAARGVAVHVMVDWLGSSRYRTALAAGFEAAGIRYAAFNPWFRRGIARMHRKIVVIDRRLAFLGGLNVNDDMICDDGSDLPLPAPRWDFAVGIAGPLVGAIHAEVLVQWNRLAPRALRDRIERLRETIAATQPLRAVQVAEAALVVRDNLRNRRTIQRAMLQALGRARHSALLVTPYFAPGRKLRKAMMLAAQRGIEVTLLIGVGQFAMQDAVAQSFYPRLVRAGVRIVEYRCTQLHGKLAVVDDDWATVGSSNFDGLSLFVNHEANIIVRDTAFAASLRDYILRGVAEGVAITLADVERLSLPRRLWNRFAYGLYRAVLQVLTLGSYTR